MAESRGTNARGRGAGSRGAQVYAVLIDKIRSRELAPGTRILEESVAEMLGVSRTPVREALTRLQARGLIEAGAGGLTIAELSRAQTMELYALRAVLEGAAARFAAENASASDLASLDFVLDRFIEAPDEPGELARLNRLLHGAIHEAAHNPYLMRMLEELTDSLALLPDTTFSHPGRTEAARDEHRRLVEAIRARDPDAADRAGRHHIDMARNARIALLFNAG